MKERRGVEIMPVRAGIQRVILYLFTGPNWVTWVTHSVIAFCIAWPFGPAAAIVTYVFYSGSKVLWALGNGYPLKLEDRIPDVAFPTMVALMTWRYL